MATSRRVGVCLVNHFSHLQFVLTNSQCSSLSPLTSSPMAASFHRHFRFFSAIPKPSGILFDKCQSLSSTSINIYPRLPASLSAFSLSDPMSTSWKSGISFHTINVHTGNQELSLLSNPKSNQSRGLSTDAGEPAGTPSAEEVRREVDRINSLFAEAREEIELAGESKETVYFNEEASVAREAVEEVISSYKALLGRLGDEERGVLQRSMGLKMEQLKGELKGLDE